MGRSMELHMNIHINMGIHMNTSMQIEKHLMMQLNAHRSTNISMHPGLVAILMTACDNYWVNKTELFPKQSLL